jgi:GT2 family glycosyltransferase
MDVSILIPVFNRVALTRACLDSLFATLPDGLAVEVFVYDDRSTDGTSDYLATQAHRVTPMRGESRGSFAKNNNAMAARSRGRFLVLLNNDTVLTPGWLEPMLELAAEPSVGVVANWHTVPGSTTVNHAGVVFDEQHRDRRLYEGMDLEGLAHARRPRELQAVIAACCVTRAEHYRAVGGLDEAYRTGYEDLEFCFRSRERGLAVLCTGASVIGHHGGSSPGRFETDTANRRLFHERWDGVVRPDLAEHTGADAVVWPSETVAYKVCRSVWRAPIAQAVMGPVLRTELGVRARQGLQRRLARDDL